MEAEPERVDADITEGAERGDSEGDRRRARRRRLLKGLVSGVPATVITLHSGALLAASSSTCVSDAAIDTWAEMNAGNLPTNSARCQTSDPGENDIVLLADNDTRFSGDGPCTASQFAVVYLDADGNFPTAPNWGGNASPTALPATNYYAVRDSCWTSFW